MKLPSLNKRASRDQRAQNQERQVREQFHVSRQATFLPGYRLYEPGTLGVVTDEEKLARRELLFSMCEQTRMPVVAAEVATGIAPNERLCLTGLDELHHETEVFVSPSAAPQAVARALESDWHCIGPADISGDSLLERALLLFQRARQHMHDDSRVLVEQSARSKRSPRSSPEEKHPNGESPATLRTVSARSVVVWWLFAAALEMQFRRETVGLAVHFFDTIRPKIPLHSWLEYAATCLLIAGKVQERYPAAEDAAKSIAGLLESLLGDEVERQASAECVESKLPAGVRTQAACLVDSCPVDARLMSDPRVADCGVASGVGLPFTTFRAETEQKRLFRTLLLRGDADAWKCFSTITPTRQGCWRVVLGSKLPPNPRRKQRQHEPASSVSSVAGPSSQTTTGTGWQRIMHLEPQVLDLLHWDLYCPTIYNCLYMLYQLERTSDLVSSGVEREWVRATERNETASPAQTPVRIEPSRIKSTASTSPPISSGARSEATPFRPMHQGRPSTVETPGHPAQVGFHTPASVSNRTRPIRLLVCTEGLADRCLHDQQILMHASDVTASACLIEALIECGLEERAETLQSFAIQRLHVSADALRDCRRQLRDKWINPPALHPQLPGEMCSARDTSLLSDATVWRLKAQAVPPKDGTSFEPSPLQFTKRLLLMQPDTLRMFTYHPMRQRWDNLLFQESLSQFCRNGLSTLKKTADVSPIDITQGRFE
ncbi:hypothetical protein CCYA_CCYA13G3519 [Cyanidiococcus yangmingshanensis]|nr:hypothetical protein CCYA_CCYA13G3519 [Cyanidiococcus yangmingshanensis]